MKWARAISSRLAFVGAVVLTPAFLAFLVANGVGSGALMLGGLAGACAVLAVSLRGSAPARRGGLSKAPGGDDVGRLISAALLLLSLGTLAVRLARAPDGTTVVCVNADCSRGAWWLRAFEERECAQAGLLLTRLLGATSREETAEFSDVFARAYAPLTPGGPNALLMTSRAGHVTTVRSEPPGTEPLPTLVFLHGFGGLLTPYVETISRALKGRWLIVAPALDPVGAWRTKRGQAVLRETLAQLPPRADRSRVFLVGLSNGAIGALKAAQDEEVRRQLAGVALVSGIAWGGDSLSGTHLLVVAGRRDPRFPFDFVSEKTAELQSQGALVEFVSLDASHALVLSHVESWVKTFERWALGGGA